MKALKTLNNSLEYIGKLLYSHLMVNLFLKIADFWFCLVKSSVLPICHSFSVLKIDLYVCSIVEFLKHNSLTKKLHVSTIITSTQNLLPSDLVWFSNLADAVLYFPSSIIVPYRSINNSIWLHENDHVFMEYIGYVPIHPNDLMNILNRPTRLCYNMMYASR